MNAPMTDQAPADGQSDRPKRALTRRRFLQALGAVGGAGAVVGSMEALGLAPEIARHKQKFRAPRASDFQLRGSVNDTSVLILGGGDAGLATAYELEKAGYRCEILEARARPGGRCWTVRGGDHHVDLDGNAQQAQFAEGLYLNAGPARIPQHHTTLEYCRELGVPIEVIINANPDAFLYREPAAGSSGSLTGKPIRRRAARADYNGYVSELLAKSTNQGALDSVLSPDDREALVEYLRGVGALGPHDRYTGSDRRGYTRPPGAADVAGTVARPYDLSSLLASGLGSAFPFEQEWDQAMPMFQPVGGMDRIPHALAAAVRGRVRYGARVRRIDVSPRRVGVTYTDADKQSYLVEADFCVCTIPPTVLRNIDNNFPAKVVAALQSLQAMSTGKMGLQFKRRFWEEDFRIYGGITDTNLDIGTIWYPSSGFHSSRGILLGYYNYLDQSERFAAMSPKQRTRRALDQGAKIHGDVYGSEYETSFSVHWQRERYSEGGWVLWQDRTHSSAYRTLLDPGGRLYFAGDHLSYVTAWQHGAFESARHVVTQLHKHVLATGGGHR
jgi:monoamine oxidase